MMKFDFRIVCDANDYLGPAIRPLLDDTLDTISHSLRIVIPVTEIDISEDFIVSFNLSFKFILIHRVDSWNGLGRKIFS